MPKKASFAHDINHPVSADPIPPQDQQSGRLTSLFLAPQQSSSPALVRDGSGKHFMPPSQMWLKTRTRGATRDHNQTSDPLQESDHAKGRTRTKYGKSIDRDVRLAKLRTRENFMLNVVMPRHRTWRLAFVDWKQRTLQSAILYPLAVIIALHVTAASYCGTRVHEEGICAGGPTGDDDQPLAYFTFQEDFGPPILNSLAALMLSFYANICLSHYKDAYLSCQTLKAAIQHLMMIVAGTIHPYDESGQVSRRGVRMEFWRCVNLYHICSYVLADKTRNTYNFDNFLVPVAIAFGEYDGEEKLGLLRRSELDLLTDESAAAASAAASAGSKPATPLGGDERRTKYVTLSNSRGDVRSRTGALHSALGVRLYALTEFVLDQKLSKASWPAWNSVLMDVARSSELMKQRALFRLPRIYRYSVRYLVASAMLTDTFIMGARAGRLLRFSASNGEWQSFALFGAFLSFVLNALAAYFVLLLIQCLAMMEQPFGSDTLDMPGLSYVCAAAETSLRTVASKDDALEESGQEADISSNANIVDYLQKLDENELLTDVPLRATAAVQAGHVAVPEARARVRRRRGSIDALHKVDDDDGGGD